MSVKPIFVIVLSIFAIGTASAADSVITTAPDYGKVQAVFTTYCAACHDWAADYGTIVDPSRIVPGKPEESLVWIVVSSGKMPAAGPPPSADEIRLLKDWIAAGAYGPAGGSAAGSANPAKGGVAAAAASRGETPAAAKSGQRFFGFPDKVAFHRFSGWAAGGTLLAAGIVGAVHAYDMMSASHAFRDANGIVEETMGTGCAVEIRSVWGAGTEQALRWTHAGLLAAGETFYLANAVTGTSMIGPLGPGLSKSKIHRFAFFAHGTLMVSEIALGFLTSDALKRGDHEMVSTLGVAHAAVGLAIPVVILSAGAIMGRK